MYYRVSDKFRLVSYKGHPYGIYNKSKFNTHFINDKEQYLLLYRCDGYQNLDESELSEHQREGIEQFEKSGIIIKSDTPLSKPATVESRFYKCFPRKEIQWSITGNCNYKCRHCFQSAPEGVLGTPSLEELLDLTRQMKNCGIHRVSLTGGEPLIRNDFMQIIDACLENEIKITRIYSNGALITQEFLNELKDRKIKCVFQISFDGIGCHDWMRGVIGAEDKALQAMKLLRDNGFGFSAAMCLCKENAASFKDTISLLADIGAEGLKVQNTMPLGNWKNESEHFLSNEEALSLYEDIIKWLAAEKPLIRVQLEAVCSIEPLKTAKEEYNVIIPMESDVPKERLGAAPSCGILLSHFFIGPNGAATPCMSMCGAKIESQFPNVFKTSLQEILTDSSLIDLTRTTRAQVIEANAKCRDCVYVTKCCAGSCRAAAVGNEGSNYLCADDFTCWFYKSGWYTRIRKLIDERFNININADN